MFPDFPRMFPEFSQSFPRVSQRGFRGFQRICIVSQWFLECSKRLPAFPSGFWSVSKWFWECSKRLPVFPSGFWSVPIVSQCFHVVFGVFQMSHAASSTFAHGHVQRPWPDRAHRHIRMIVSTISLSSKDHNWRMWCRDSKAVLINLNK